MTTITFRVIARTKTENPEGTSYQVRLKSSEGHRLTLKSTTEAKGYFIGETVTVEVKNPQKTLGGAP